MSIVKKLVKTVTKVQASEELHKFLSIKANSVFYRMTLAFGLFFLGPFLGFTYLGVKTKLFGTNELLYCFLAVLVLSFVGYIILKQIADSIMNIETHMTRKSGVKEVIGRKGENELNNIVLLADAMDQHIGKISQSLTRRMQEINALGELGNLSIYKTSSESIIEFALEKAVIVAGAFGGGIFTISRNDASTKVICRHTYGQGVALPVGRRVLVHGFPFEAMTSEKAIVLMGVKQAEYLGAMFDSSADSLVAIPYNQRHGHSEVAILIKREGKSWDENGIGFLTTLFHAAGSILKMQELGIREKETTDELKAILYMIKIVNSELGEDDLIRTISGRLCTFIPGQWVGLALIDENDGQLTLAHSFYRSEDDKQSGLILDKETSLFQMAADTADLIGIEDLDNEEKFFSERSLFAERGLKSCIIKRLEAGGKVIGTLCLASDIAGGFNRKDKRMFAMAALGVALALEQTRLLAKERAKSTELKILNRIGNTLTSTILDMDNVLHDILEQITEFIKVEAGAVMLIQDDLLTFQATTGAAKQNLVGLKIRIGQEGVSGWVAATGEAVIVQDVDSNPQFCADIDKRTGFKTKNLLCVPIITTGRVIGVIELLNKKGATFTDEDLSAIKSVAAAMAISLENTRLYNESVHLARKERFIRTIFQKYVPEEIVNDILQKGESDQLKGGERKIVTVFNVDIRGYSAMSKLAATEDVVDVLNCFFRKMGDIVLQHKGVLDKYLGDGLLAIFGAPVPTINPALDATLAAIEMTEAINEVSDLALQRCGFPLKIGISINTGEALVGNIGFDKKMEYTVIGDVVNETFRLQDLTPRKSNSILISESTYKEVKLFVYANRWTVKKSANGEDDMDIFEVMGRKDIADLDYALPESMGDSAPVRIH